MIDTIDTISNRFSISDSYRLFPCTCQHTPLPKPKPFEILRIQPLYQLQRVFRKRLHFGPLRPFVNGRLGMKRRVNPYGQCRQASFGVA